MSRLYNILNELVNRGQYYAAAWTATSTNSNGARLTDDITLPKGTYILSAKVPVVTSGTFPGVVLKQSGGTDLENGSLAALGSQMEASFIVKLSAQKTVYMAVAGSAACSYSYLERGWLRAVRIA